MNQQIKYPHVYSSGESKKTIADVETRLAELSGVFANIKGPLKTSLIEAFDEGRKKGSATEIVHIWNTTPAKIRNDSLWQNNPLQNINDVLWFREIAQKALLNSDQKTYEREMNVVRDNFRLLGETAGLCSRTELDMTDPRFLDGAWDSELKIMEFLINLQSIVETAKSEPAPVQEYAVQDFEEPARMVA